MYSLDINFLKEREQQQPQKRTETTTTGESPSPVEGRLPVIIGAAVGLVPILIVIGSGLLLKARTARNQEIISQLEQEVQTGRKIQTDITELKQAQEATKEQAQQHLNTLVDIFKKIRSLYAILEDIRTRAPDNLQVNAIQQEGTQQDMSFQVEGVAGSFEKVNLFFLRLQRSPFVRAKSVNLETANQSQAKIQIEQMPEDLGEIAPANVISYQLSFDINDTPSSDEQMLTALQEAEATGLVARIRALQQQGLIE